MPCETAVGRGAGTEPGHPGQSPVGGVGYLGAARGLTGVNSG